MLDSTRPEVNTRNRKSRAVSKTSAVRDAEVDSTNDPAKTIESRMQWTVKGIDKQTLEASRIAARKRGMKFGAWVNEVLRAASSDEAVEHVTTSKELLDKIAEIEFKLDQSVGELKQQTTHIQHDVRVLHMLVPKSAAG
jgi:hypothetical protein